jgi:hypothetical protein
MDRMHARVCISQEGGRRVYNDGQMGCMLKHAYHERVDRQLINDEGWDAYWGTHSVEITGMGRDRWRDACLRVHAKVEREGRDACLRAHAKVRGPMGWWDRMHT